ncbi:unnamed protein product [Chrysoparadoxa australica]
MLELAREGQPSQGYSFDLCAHEGFSQSELFNACGLLTLLDAAVDGYACTVFAYGATGSGKVWPSPALRHVLLSSLAPSLAPNLAPIALVKTYSMSGFEQAQGKKSSRQPSEPEIHENDGLVPRSVHHIFDRIREASTAADVKFTVRASYAEVYNEQVVFDLLNFQKNTPLAVRYNVKRGFFVQGLFEVEINELVDILAVIEEGNSNRRVAGHLMNQDSSRSHSLLSIYLHSQQTDSEDGHVISKYGKVIFVDLAGSERLKRTQAQNEKETGSINKSLMTLGKVSETEE